MVTIFTDNDIKNSFGEEGVAILHLLKAAENETMACGEIIDLMEDEPYVANFEDACLLLDQMIKSNAIRIAGIFPNLVTGGIDVLVKPASYLYREGGR